jgi:hypothetical protein
MSADQQATYDAAVRETAEALPPATQETRDRLTLLLRDTRTAVLQRTVRRAS